MNSNKHISNSLSEDLKSTEIDRLLLESSKDYHGLSEIDVDSAWNRFEKKNTGGKLRRLSSGLRIAASFLFMAAIGLGIYQYNAADGMEMVLAEVNKDFRLSDKSEVTLKKDSRLEYAKNFGESRDVKLSGEAFFSIEKDGRPFQVFAGDVKVRVLGTAFNVDMKDNGNVVVSVQEGRVECINPAGDLVLLRANEKAVYRKETVSFETTEARSNDWSWPEDMLQFTSEPLENVVSDISDFYNVDIVIKKKKMRKCLFTLGLPLKDVSVEETLELITVPHGMSIDQDAQGVYVLSKGYCKE